MIIKCIIMYEMNLSWTIQTEYSDEVNIINYYKQDSIMTV